jgi:alpha-beta hydrolase superfamily lysophospholipase
MVVETPATRVLTLITPDGLRLAGTRVDAPRASRGIVLAHGITAEQSEDGFFTELAEHLAGASVSSLRFDFRGHGHSEGAPEEMTIAGETLDLATAVSALREHLDAGAPLGIVAASFATVSTSRLVHAAPGTFDFIVLLNPVLDMRRTFIAPELPWARRSFTPEALAALPERGAIVIDDTFAVGPGLVAEMDSGPQPTALLGDADVPMLVVHGTQDTYVSFDIARDFATSRSGTTFVAIDGAEHGFGLRHEADAVRDHVLRWLRGLG